MTSEVLAPAKVNLTLHITGQRPDGYHLLDSLVAFADLGDHLSFAPAATNSLQITGPFASGVPTDHHNSVLKAAGLVGASHCISLEKNLPHGAGIGGGSADAAAVLRYFGVTENAASLGADVPVCLRSTVQRMRGIGDILTPVVDLPSLTAVLVNPGVHVSTPEVFGGLGQKENAPMPDLLPAFSSTGDLITWLGSMRNDLQSPACSQLPSICDVIGALSRVSPLARMSGSGGTCFGLFETRQQADRAAQDLAREHPDWWVQSVALS